MIPPLFGKPGWQSKTYTSATHTVSRIELRASLRAVSVDQLSPVPAAASELSAGDFIGVDVGGTKVSIATMHEGRLAEPHLLSTECSSQDALIDQLSGGIEEARRRCEGNLLAVGIGIPSVVAFPSGHVRSSVNIPLHDVALADVLRERLGGIAVYVNNDANCAALAEAHDESGRLQHRHLVMFTVGTGVGGGIIIDGRPYRGATGAAGELGHMLITLDPSDDHEISSDFPQPGSLEALASGQALDALARRTAGQYPDSALGRAVAEGRKVAGPDLVVCAREGDEHALAALALLGRRLGVGIASAINIFDPEVVAVGGGVSAAHELLLDHARRCALALVLPGVGESTEIRLARSGPQAGVRGAALLASQLYGSERAAGH